MEDVNAVCDYVLFRLKTDEEVSCNHLKLQKLLYYIQAWHCAFNSNQPLFGGKFQAWVHGPVHRDIYNRFKDTKGLYSEMKIEDISTADPKSVLNSNTLVHIDSVLDVYAGFAGFQLERMTHEEDPWINARSGVPANVRCEREIENEWMGDYYRKRLA